MDTTEDGRMSEASSARHRGGRRRSIASPMDEMDEMASVGGRGAGTGIRPQLRCNACWDPILADLQSAQTCYRTSCSHLFCVRLAASVHLRLFGRAMCSLTRHGAIFVCCFIHSAQEKCAYKHFGAGRLVCPACSTVVRTIAFLRSPLRGSRHLSPSELLTSKCGSRHGGICET
ncbi:hypothetical protein PybrP1_011069 [[Pythium] brassicae (nom. inval.)]|nr:hypothetical protein PybrP1_011069 [[Pythium] brassicae (nom. inval.)]